MAFFRGLSRRIQYGVAILVAIALAFPMVCGMFLVLSFGMGMLAWLAVLGIVFGAPIWLFVSKRTESSASRRAEIWQAWALCLIVHLGFSAGLCRVTRYLPNAPNVKEGPFVQDYLQVAFMPVVIVYVLAEHGLRRSA